VSRPRATRPPRGTPIDTRRRLVAAAAEAFNRDGYDGTDSNRIAAAAGYSPGTFYKHFTDKKQIFLAVYAEWVAGEWQKLAATLADAGSDAELATRVVEIFVTHHRKWRGIRASLRRLVAVDDEVRDYYRAQRRVQLAELAALRRGRGRGSRERDALLLFTVERVADGLADGEAAALELDRAALERLLVELVRTRVAAARRR
jgi:AcrR family transcriptional regulator